MKKRKTIAILMAALLAVIGFSQCLVFAAETGGAAQAEAGEALTVDADGAGENPETVEEVFYEEDFGEIAASASETPDTMKDVIEADEESEEADFNPQKESAEQGQETGEAIPELGEAVSDAGSKTEGRDAIPEAQNKAEDETENGTGAVVVTGEPGSGLKADEDKMMEESPEEDSESFAAMGAGEGTGPVIALTYVPVYGKKHPLQGQIFMQDGSSFTSSDYRIALFLQISEKDRCWTKPTNEKPYLTINADGSFRGMFCTGDNDEYARILHVILIPSDYTPESGPDAFDKALEKKIDYVKIVRDQGGSVAVTPERKAPELEKAPAVDSPLPVKQDKIAVDVGFYTDREEAAGELSESLIREHLTAVKKFSDTVRFYNSEGEINKAYGIAHEMGFSVIGTAHLSRNKEDNEAEMKALIDLCNKGYVQVACVGNETLLEKNNQPPVLTPEELIRDIEFVRAGITNDEIPVTTSDDISVLIENPMVTNACNLIMPNCYPFWGGIDISKAADNFIDSITSLQAVSDGKQVIVSETGWPTAEGAKGDAVSGEAQAAQYYKAVRVWSLSTGTQVFYFESTDEPWKKYVPEEETFGDHWGFMTNDFKLKDGYKNLDPFNKITYEITKDNVTVAGGVFTYDRKKKTPAVTVKYENKTLKSGTDYMVAYKNNTNAGTASVTVTGKGNFSGSVTKTFTIKKADQTITTSKKTYSATYGGKAFSLGAKAKTTLSYVSSNTKVLKVDKEGTVSIVGAGTAKITITAAASTNYNKATKTLSITVAKAKPTFTVTAKTLKKTFAASALKKKAQVFTPTVKVNSKGKLTYKKQSGRKVITVNKTTGKITVEKGTKAGKYTAKIRVTAAAKGNYKSGTKDFTVTVIVK